MQSALTAPPDKQDVPKGQTHNKLKSGPQAPRAWISAQGATGHFCWKASSRVGLACVRTESKGMLALPVKMVTLCGVLQNLVGISAGRACSRVGTACVHG